MEIEQQHLPDLCQQCCAVKKVSANTFQQVSKIWSISHSEVFVEGAGGDHFQKKMFVQPILGERREVMLASCIQDSGLIWGNIRVPTSRCVRVDSC